MKSKGSMKSKGPIKSKDSIVKVQKLPRNIPQGSEPTTIWGKLKQKLEEGLSRIPKKDNYTFNETQFIYLTCESIFQQYFIDNKKNKGLWFAKNYIEKYYMLWCIKHFDYFQYKNIMNIKNLFSSTYQNISQNAGIPKMIIDSAMRFHKKISETKTFRGLNRDGIIAASIYIACRVNNYPRTSKEIADIFNLDNGSATKGCKNALTIINEIQKDNNDDVIKLNETIPLAFIERYCSKLNINTELTNLCKFIANKLEKKNLIPENTPHSIAGGIIYFVCQMCNLNISKSTINSISKISEVTINKCFKKLEQHKEELIPNVILRKYS